MLRSSLAHALRCAFAGTFFSFVLISHAAAQTTYWELEPVKDAKIGAGAFTAIRGRTAPAGVHFKLKNNKLTAPVVMTLIAQDAAKPVKISAFKESGPLFDMTTDAQGKASRSFRSGEEILFKLTGESGVGYQLSVWRGPEIILPKPSPFKPMSEVLGTAAAAAAGAGVPVAAATAETKGASAGGGGLGATANVLLFGILAVLLVIGFLIFRGQQMKGRAPLLIFALMSAAAAADAQEENIDLRPKPVEEEQRDPRIAEEAQKTIDKLKTAMEQFKAVTHDKYDLNSPLDLSALSERGLKGAKVDVAGILQTALNLLETFEIIDPREKFVQADYAPAGLPVLPSRAMSDNLSPQVYGEFRALQENINKARTHLENNYVVLKQTELKTKRLTDLADTAGGISAIAGVYWARAKADENDPMNKSKTKFYQNYDNGQESGLKFLNDTLKEMAEFELTHYGDRNWYLYFGLPYYNFMVARYVRK